MTFCISIRTRIATPSIVFFGMAALALGGCNSRAEPAPIPDTAADKQNSEKIVAGQAKAAKSDRAKSNFAGVRSPDQASYVVKRVLQIDGPFRHGDYVWDDEGVPDGPMVITVDLKAETLSVFKGGYEIGAAVILFGADEKPTPTGVYPITQKNADHVSNLYGSPMPYMLRMTNDGISIHGSEIDWGYATHGCIGVPVAFARKLFGAVKLGDKIIVTNGETLKAGQAITAI